MLILLLLINNKPRVRTRAVAGVGGSFFYSTGYFESNYSSCIRTYLRMFNEYKVYNDFLLEKMILVADFNEYRSFRIMHRIYGLDFESYYFNQNFDKFESDSNMPPYVMVVDSNLYSHAIKKLDFQDKKILFNYLDIVKKEFYK